MRRRFKDRILAFVCLCECVYRFVQRQFMCAGFVMLLTRRFAARKLLLHTHYAMRTTKKDRDERRFEVAFICPALLVMGFVYIRQGSLSKKRERRWTRRDMARSMAEIKCIDDISMLD